MEPTNIVLGYIEILVWPLVAALAIATAARLFLPERSQRSYQPTNVSKPPSQTLDKLDGIISEAEKFAKLASPQEPDPIIHLKGTIKITPQDFWDATRQIHENIHSQKVTLLDLAACNEKESTRIVDFCTGFSTGSASSIFQISSTALMLIPKPD